MPLPCCARLSPAMFSCDQGGAASVGASGVRASCKAWTGPHLSGFLREIRGLAQADFPCLRRRLLLSRLEQRGPRDSASRSHAPGMVVSGDPWALSSVGVANVRD